MDRAEAAKQIKEIQKLYVFTPTINEALDLAIEALGQTESEDCISRKQAIEALTGWETDPLDEDIVRTLNNLPVVAPDIKTFCGVPIKEAIEVLEKYKHSPSVTPTERIGEWVSLFDGNEWFVHCSKCKTQHYVEDLLMGDSELPNFCPNCGAKMKGADDEQGA